MPLDFCGDVAGVAADTGVVQVEKVEVVRLPWNVPRMV